MLKSTKSTLPSWLRSVAGFLGMPQLNNKMLKSIRSMRPSEFKLPTLLGTAGAIKLAQNLLADDFMVINGDTYLPIDYNTW